MTFPYNYSAVLDIHGEHTIRQRLLASAEWALVAFFLGLFTFGNGLIIEQLGGERYALQATANNELEFYVLAGAASAIGIAIAVSVSRVSLVRFRKKLNAERFAFELRMELESIHKQARDFDAQQANLSYDLATERVASTGFTSPIGAIPTEILAGKLDSSMKGVLGGAWKLSRQTRRQSDGDHAMLMESAADLLIDLQQLALLLGSDSTDLSRVAQGHAGLLSRLVLTVFQSTYVLGTAPSESVANRVLYRTRVLEDAVARVAQSWRHRAGHEESRKQG